MRRALALLLIALAVPAQAGRVLVIRQGPPANSEASNVPMRQLGNVEAVLKAFGVQYDVVNQIAVASCATCPATNVSQAAIRTGLVSWSTTGTTQTQYAGIIHMGFTANGNGAPATARVAGYNPDTLTLARSSGGVTTTWPQIPTIFFGIGNVSSGSIFASTATCSTGVVGTMAGLSSLKSDMAFHLVGRPEVWKSGYNSGGNGQHAYFHAGANGLTITATAPGVTKARVVYGASASAVRDSGSFYCNDCDSLFTPGGTYFSSPASDSAVIWTRERYSGDPAPLIFALPTCMGNNGIGDITLIAMAVAIMDSASGGQIIGQTPTWRPSRMGFVVSGAMSHSFSQSSFNGVTSSFGWNIHGGGAADSTYIKQGIDSLASLGVPVLVTVNVDSIASYPNEKSWWSRRLPTARFSPESRVYTDSLNVNGGETSANRYTSPDVFGIYRSRQLITPTRYDFCTLCGDADSTLSCQVSFMKGRLDSVPEFRGRMSRTIMAPWFDYIPRNFNRNSMPDPDSFAVALWRSGFDTAINGTMHVYSTPSLSWGLATGGAPNIGQTTFSPGTWYPNPRTQIIKTSSGQQLSQFKWLNMRHFDEDIFGSSPFAHDIIGEFWEGFFAQPWYIQDVPYWNHVMRARLNVVLVRPADLGCAVAGATVPVASRPGFYFIKYVVNQVRAINKLAGRTVISFAYPEDIEP